MKLSIHIALYLLADVKAAKAKKAKMTEMVEFIFDGRMNEVSNSSGD